MTPSDFCVWLQGFLAVERSTKNLPNKEVEQIKEKLNSVVRLNLSYNPPPGLLTDGIVPINNDWYPGYNHEASDFARITCESGPCCSG